MNFPIRLCIASVYLLTGEALAAPRVVTDIAPVHSLVAQVMEGLGEPTLLLPPTASPHDYALRPSDARALGKADTIFWIGHALTPWLEKPLDALAGSASVVDFLERDSVSVHEYGDKDHEAVDPHIWLDPDNAKAMLLIIAETLAEADSENAAAYRENATRALDRIDLLTGEIETNLAPLKGVPYIVFHDAYRYFEARFGVESISSVALGDADKPGARRIAEVRRTIAEVAPKCAFAEPQFPERTIRMVLNGSVVRQGILDPMGAAIEPGPDLYDKMMRGLATAMQECLGG